MARRSEGARDAHNSAAWDFTVPRIGTLAAVTTDGRAYVTFPGCGKDALPARSAVTTPRPRGEHPEALVGAPVLLAFENADARRPIIIGWVRDELRPDPAPPEAEVQLGRTPDLVVDGNRLVIDARREILLRCGKSSLLLQRDGRVLIRGTHVVSRSSGPNKLRGGSISLN